MQEELRAVQRWRSFHSSAPATATAGSQGPPPPPPPTSRSDRDDLRLSLDHFRKPVPPVGATASSHLLEEGACDGYTLPHPVWSDEELNSVKITHTPPEKPVDTVLCHNSLTDLNIQLLFTPAGCVLLCPAVEDRV